MYDKHFTHQAISSSRIKDLILTYMPLIFFVTLPEALLSLLEDEESTAAFFFFCPQFGDI